VTFETIADEATRAMTIKILRTYLNLKSVLRMTLKMDTWPSDNRLWSE
jgi:hypothetical protein